jgi:hypothetical protein
VTTATVPASVDPHASPPGAHTLQRHRLGARRLLRGPADQAAWVRPVLLLELVATAVLYLWNLGASGNANSFYAAAAQAGTMSWKAMFFGSLDPSNFITVDKPPAAMWVMALSGRIFGCSKPRYGAGRARWPDCSPAPRSR